MDSSEKKPEQISSKLKPIIGSIRDQIERGQTKHVMADASGWRHGGEEFSKSVELLQTEIEEELKKHSLHVLACAVRHFLSGAKILNPFYPTKRLLIIPINGASTISGVPIPIDTYCYIGNQPALSGEDIDVVIVAYEVSHKSS